MPGVAKEITLEQLSKWCHFVPAKLADLSTLFDACEIAFTADARMNFANQSSPDGVPWTILGGLTADARRSGGSGKEQVLRDNGILMNAVTTQGAKGNIHERTATTLIWGTNLKYAKTHQEGLTITAKNVRNLAIPMTTEAREIGSPRNFPEERKLHWMPSKKPGVSLLYEQTDLAEGLTRRSQGRRGTGSSAYRQTAVKGARIFHYLLKKSVDIPKRPFLGIGKRLEKKIENIFEQHLGEALI